MRDSGVLVVDDNADMLDFIKKMFGFFKLKADFVQCPSEALECLKINGYGTMVTDLEMPDMNGLELARKARELFPDLHIVMYAGDTSPYIQKIAFDANISEVHCIPSGLGRMVKSIINKENGKSKL